MYHKLRKQEGQITKAQRLYRAENPTLVRLDIRNLILSFSPDCTVHGKKDSFLAISIKVQCKFQIVNAMLTFTNIL